jgi:hypothetical protein
VKEFYTKINEIVKPYLATPIVVRFYTVQTTLCEHFVNALDEAPEQPRSGACSLGNEQMGPV